MAGTSLGAVHDSFTLPRGFGFRVLLKEELAARQDLLDTLAIWELPRKRGDVRYILGVDVSDGMGLDRSCVDVHRFGTIQEPEEQVAQFVTDRLTPVQLAYVVDAVGRFYCDRDGFEALAAIECNNHGLSTQDTLQLHLGYAHFYRWEYLDAADPKKRYSTKLGWMTTTRTRPMLLDKLYEALTTYDPTTHWPDLVVHSGILRSELRDFQTEGALWEASAARGAHDDCIMACAIAHYIQWRLQGGEQEPLDERRRRHHEEESARQASVGIPGQALPKRDWRNTGCTADEWKAGVEQDDDSLYDDRAGPTILH